jgi:hypothetical protein
LARRARSEGAEHAQLALAQAAADLMRGGESAEPWPSVVGPRLQELPNGTRAVPPPGTLDGRPLRF